MWQRLNIGNGNKKIIFLKKLRTDYEDDCLLGCCSLVEVYRHFRGAEDRHLDTRRRENQKSHLRKDYIREFLVANQFGIFVCPSAVKIYET
jgi:hypothetical protein